MFSIKNLIHTYYSKITKKYYSQLYIPNGWYCYKWIETPRASNNGRGKVEYCPYWKLVSQKRWIVGCLYLNYLSFNDCCLSDGCKMCGVKE